MHILMKLVSLRLCRKLFRAVNYKSQTSPICHMSSRTACKPSGPCKSTTRNTSKPCETLCETAAQPPRPSEASDHRSPPKLCSHQSSTQGKSRKFCHSLDLHKQTILSGVSKTQSSCRSWALENSEQASYPQKPWPTLGRPTTWSPTNSTTYVPKSRFSDSCNPGKGCKSNKSSCPDPCASRGDACKGPCKQPPTCQAPPDPCKQSSACQTPPDPCKKPDPCQSTPCPTCPTCPPPDNPNLWTQELSYKTAAGSLPCVETPVLCGQAEHERKMKLFRMLSLYVCLPIIALVAGMVRPYVIEDHKQPRPEYIPYTYLYIRTKKFAWGDGNHTLFHNPERNAVPPDGYEVPDPNAVIQPNNTEDDVVDEAEE